MSTTSRALVHFTLTAIAAVVVSMPASAQWATTTDAQGEYVRGRVLVAPRAGLAEPELAKVVGAHGGRARAIGGSGIYIVDLPAQASETAVMQQLGRNPHLKFAELDRRVPHSLAVNDPYIGSQWHTAKIAAPSAWDLSGGGGVVIAILDTGVDVTHPDLASRVVPGWNIYDNNADTADVHGHGTAVAGTAAATMNNGTGVAGVAGQAKIMPLRISDPTGYAYWSTIAQGINYAADNGARVASISYASLTQSSAVLSAAQYMRSKGGLVVVAAGNSGASENYTPTTYLIPVSATDGNDQMASFSSYGSFVAMSAPGSGIWTTNRGGGYGSWSGTSFSTPITAGTIALMLAAKPGISSSQVESLLYSTATDLGATGRDDYFGYGRVNADAAVRAAANATAGDSTPPTASISAPVAGSIASGLVAVNVNANDNVGVTKVELRVNGSVYATDTSSPYAFSWDSTKVANGTANLQAVAYDAAGNAGSSATTTVTVSNGTPTPGDTTPPIVAIVAPTNGVTVSGTVTVSANATDNIGVTKVEFWINNSLAATATSSPYSFSWNTRKLSGTQTIVAKAFDAAGNTASSNPYTVTVVAPTNGRK